MPFTYRATLAASVLLGACFVCGEAAAHTFGTVYNLPVPFYLYAYGASAALVVSFAIVAYLASVPSAGEIRPTGRRQAPGKTILRLGVGWIIALRVASVFALVLTIVAGFVGTRNPYANINMTLFWVIFALGCFYLVALIGDFFALANPWRVLCDVIDRAFPRLFRARSTYPAALGYYPALVLYFAFIWIELFGRTQPRSLAVVLLVYTVINVIGALIVGKDAWFRYGEFFGVMFRVAGKIAPVEYVPEGAGARYRIRIRRPFAALIAEPAEHASLLLFVLFMLSSTAFDGIHETLPWVTVFWRDIYPLLTALINRPYLFFVDFYYYWQWLMLLLSPFVYLAIYLLFISLARLSAASTAPLRILALRFAMSLVPIAFVYNVTHYYTLLVSQGANMVRFISDPFGMSWDLFGTAQSLTTPVILDAGGVWHTQVGLILFGHIVGVYLAHIEALKSFPDTRRAILSQVPMLVLMVLFTTAGLWILSLPIAAGQVVQP
ncbi:MAG TPA: hypothetical protein VGL25_04830, partial [Casimicrobiaceae bacterium]